MRKWQNKGKNWLGAYLIFVVVVVCCCFHSPVHRLSGPHKAKASPFSATTAMKD